MFSGIRISFLTKQNTSTINYNYLNVPKKISQQEVFAV